MVNSILDNKKKGILTLISAVLINLLTGNLFSFPNFIPYYKSFLYYRNGKIEEVSDKQLYYVAPVGIFIHNTLPSVTGLLDQMVGTRILYIIGSISLLISQLLMYNFIDYYIIIISYILFGLCGSLTYFQSLKNCWKYFPDKKGLISGIIFSSFGLSAFIFTSLGDYIINPKDDHKNKDGYYSEEISEKFLTYIKVYIICIISMGTISCLLCFPFKEESLKESDNPENIEINKDISVTDNGNSENDENHYSVVIKEETKMEENDNLTLKESLLSLDFFLCLTVAGCTLIYGFLLTNTYRNFGSITLKGYETELKYLSKAFTLLNTFSRLVWGLIFDKIGFKFLYIIVCVNQLICGGLIYISSKKIVTYFIVVCFGVLSYAGHIILFPNLIHHKFGVDNSVVILGICGIFGGISALVGPILTDIIENNEDYLKIYLIGVAPTIASLLITCFIKDERLQKNKTMHLVDEEDVLMKEGDTNNHKELDSKDKK